MPKNASMDELIKTATYIYDFALFNLLALLNLLCNCGYLHYRYHVENVLLHITRCSNQEQNYEHDEIEVG